MSTQKKFPVPGCCARVLEEDELKTLPVDETDAAPEDITITAVDKRNTELNTTAVAETIAAVQVPNLLLLPNACASDAQCCFLPGEGERRSGPRGQGKWNKWRRREGRNGWEVYMDITKQYMRRNKKHITL